MLWFCGMAGFAALSSPARAQLQTHTSRAYTIYSDLPKDEVALYARHMDQVFAEYQSRFSSFRGKRTGPMPLYLFATQQGYMQFLAGHRIDGTNSGGMFFVQMGAQGLATFIEGSSRAEVFSVLQHEGFHQFAYNYIGGDLPVWVNEGLAQYFEDGIIVGKTMKLGISNQDRIDRVKAALAGNYPLNFDRLLTMSGGQWAANLQGDAKLAALQYAQSWSVVYFLIHGDRGKYRGPFEQYLQAVSQGRDSSRAFREAFRSNDTTEFRRRWEKFARDHEPDDFTTGLVRMRFLAAGLSYLHGKGETMPKTLDELKTRLQAVSFRITRSSHGMAQEFAAADDANFVYPRGKATPLPFQLLDPARDDLPPRIAAPGLKPEPTLVWMKDPGGELVSDVEFR